MAIEVPSAARAQVAGGQEFADFNTSLGIGTYATQLRLLHLPTIDNELIGFEGAFSANTSHGHYGFVVPYHNKVRFFGKLVRVNLFMMENITECMKRWRTERNVSGVSENDGSGTRECLLMMMIHFIFQNEEEVEVEVDGVTAD